MTIAPARPTPATPTRPDPARREPAPDVSNDEFDRIMERHADTPRRDDPAPPAEPHTRRRVETADEPSGDERTEPAPGRAGPEHGPGVGGTDRDATDPSSTAPRPTDTTDLAAATPPVPTTGTPAVAPAPVDVGASPAATTAGASAPLAVTTATPGPPGPATDPTTTATTTPTATTNNMPATTSTATTNNMPAGPMPTAPITDTGAVGDPSVAGALAPTATDHGASGEHREQPAATAPGNAATTGPTTSTRTADPAGTVASTTIDGTAVVPDGDLPVDPSADPASTTPADGPPEPGPVRVESSPVTAAAPERPGNIGDARSIAAGRTGSPEHRSEPALHPSTAAPHADDLLARAELRRVTGRGSRLDIGLSTSDLGRIEVAVVDRGNGLQLQLTSDQPDARRHLARHLDELRGDLADAGLDVGSLDVGDSPRHGRQPEQPGHPDGPVGADRAPTSPTRPTHAVGGGRPVPARIEATDGLDLRL